jgi:hypothetical protein
VTDLARTFGPANESTVKYATRAAKALRPAGLKLRGAIDAAGEGLYIAAMQSVFVTIVVAKGRRRRTRDSARA